jgi:hypothetical protein
MARTYRRGEAERRPWWRKEIKVARKLHYRSYRARSKAATRKAMATEDEEPMPVYCRTSGWLTH